MSSISYTLEDSVEPEEIKTEIGIDDKASFDVLTEDNALGDAVDFNRSNKEKELWDKIVGVIKGELSPTDDGSIVGLLKDGALRIESGFKYAQHDEDIRYNRLQVEQLIDQAADLLDRGIRDRSNWDMLAEKSIKLWLELSEYYHLESIHSEEEKEGKYDIEHLESLSRFNAERTISEHNRINLGNAERFLETLHSLKTKNEVNGWAQRAAWLQGLVLYSFGDAGFNGYVNHTFNGESLPPSEHFMLSTFNQVAHQQELQRVSAFFQKENYYDAKSISNARLAGVESRQNWEEKNRLFRKRRTIVARKHQDIKAKIATDEDGILNHAKRMEPIKDRFQRDFRDAIAKLKSSLQGLSEIYGYDQPLPDDEANIKYFDDCLLWVRDTIQWMNRFSSRDQSAVFPISIKDLIGDSEWESNYGSWVFELPMNKLAGMKHVRLRGISLSVEDRVRTRDRTWQFRVNVPTEGIAEHLNGKVVTIDQSTLPSCLLGSVIYYDDPRELDVVGISALHNASPFGKSWKVKILNSVPSRKGNKGLSDVILHLYINFTQ